MNFTAMEYTADQIRGALLNSPIPDYMHDGIMLWLEKGIQPGSFLTAVIENDLRSAVAEADDHNIYLIPDYVRFFYNYMPHLSWGKPGAIEQWQHYINKHSELPQAS